MQKGDKRVQVFVRLCLALGLCAASQVAMRPAYAGQCSQEIARFEAEARQASVSPLSGPTAPESTGAKLGHQPTPESVRRAEEGADSDFVRLLRQAQRLDAANDETGCMDSLAQARQMFELR